MAMTSGHSTTLAACSPSRSRTYQAQQLASAPLQRRTALERGGRAWHRERRSQTTRWRGTVSCGTPPRMRLRRSGSITKAYRPLDQGVDRLRDPSEIPAWTSGCRRSAPSRALAEACSLLAYPSEVRKAHDARQEATPARSATEASASAQLTRDENGEQTGDREDKGKDARKEELGARPVRSATGKPAQTTSSASQAMDSTRHRKTTGWSRAHLLSFPTRFRPGEDPGPHSLGGQGPPEGSEPDGPNSGTPNRPTARLNSNW